MLPEYLTVAEIATQLRVTPQAVNGWCRKGRLEAVRAGRSWRVRPADLERFLHQQPLSTQLDKGTVKPSN